MMLVRRSTGNVSLEVVILVRVQMVRVLVVMIVVDGKSNMRLSLWSWHRLVM